MLCLNCSSVSAFEFEFEFAFPVRRLVLPPPLKRSWLLLLLLFLGEEAVAAARSSCLVLSQSANCWLTKSDSNPVAESSRSASRDPAMLILRKRTRIAMSLRAWSKSLHSSNTLRVTRITLDTGMFLMLPEVLLPSEWVRESESE